MPQRVTVFFDWQNVYKRAREAFDFDGQSSDRGQADPVELAALLRDRHAEQYASQEFELHEIRIYRGKPDRSKDPRGYDAFQRQTARWEQNVKVVPQYKDLRYPYDWGESTCTEKPREKGVDVALAVDLVTLADSGEYDVALVMSADHDLVPAIQYVRKLGRESGAGPHLALAAWKGEVEGRPLRINVPGDKVWCHWLTKEDYWGVEDARDYSVRPEPRSVAGGPRPGSWLN